MRRNARVDKNQPEIIGAFRKLGWSVLIISNLHNCCDLIVSKNGRTIAVEVKDGDKPKSQQKLTKGESNFERTWQGEYKIITSINDVINIDN